MSEKPRAPRIDWTADEDEFLAVRVQTLRLKEPATPFSRLVRRAMQQLPANRRVISQISPSALKRLEARIIAINKQLSEQSSEAQSLRQRLEAAQAKEPNIEQVLEKVGISRLLRLLPRTAMLHEALDVLLEVQRGTIVTGMDKPVVPRADTRRKPRIQVVGAESQQWTVLRKRYPKGAAKWQYVQKISQLNGSTPDVLLQFTQFESHSMTEAALKHARKHGCLMLIADTRQALSALRDKLDRFFADWYGKPIHRQEILG